MPYENAHAAKINADGIVEQVIVIPRQEGDRDDLVTAYCNSIGLPGTWLDTSYVGKRRGRFAGIGMKYDEELDEYVAPEAPAADEPAAAS